MPGIECASAYPARRRHVQDLASLPRVPYRKKNLNSNRVNFISVVAPHCPKLVQITGTASQESNPPRNHSPNADFRLVVALFDIFFLPLQLLQRI